MLYRKTDKQWQLYNPGLDRLGATHLLTLRDPYLGRRPYFGNYCSMVSIEMFHLVTYRKFVLLKPTQSRVMLRYMVVQENPGTDVLKSSRNLINCIQVSSKLSQRVRVHSVTITVLVTNISHNKVTFAVVSSSFVFAIAIS